MIEKAEPVSATRNAGVLLDGATRRDQECWTWHAPTETVLRWSAKHLECIQSIKIPFEPGQKLGLTARGRALVEAINAPGIARSARLVLRDDRGRVVHTLSDQLNDAFRASVSDDGSRGAVAGFRTYLESFDPIRGQRAWWPTDHTGWGGALRIDPERAITYASDGRIRAWNLVHGTRLWAYEAAGRTVQRVALSAGGSLLALLVSEHDRTASVLELRVDTGELVQHVPIDATDSLGTLHPLSDGGWVMAGSPILRHQGHGVTPVAGTGRARQTWWVGEDPGGQHGAFLVQEDLGGHLYLVDAKAGTRTELATQHAPVATALACTEPAPAILLADTQGQIARVEALGGTLRWVTSAHRGRITQLAISDEGSLLLSAGGDGYIRLWDAKSGANLGAWPAPPTGVHWLGFSGTVEGIVRSPTEGGGVSTCRRLDLRRSGEFRDVVLTSPCPGVATRPGPESEWELRSCAVLASFDLTDGKQLAEMAIPFHQLRGLWLSDDARWALLRDDRREVLCDLALGSHREMASPRRLTATRWFEPDGVLITAEGMLHRFSGQEFVEIEAWPLPRGHLVARALRPDESRWALATDEGLVVVLSRFTGRTLWTLEGSRVHAVAWSTDGAVLAVARAAMVEWHRADDGRLVGSSDLFAEVAELTAVSETVFAALDYEGHIHFCAFEPPKR